MSDSLHSLAARVGARLIARAQKLAIAESCTGGWISKCVTDVPGSSEWFDCGFVTYSNEAKVRLLGVQRALLERHGAVSHETVRQMTAGALANSQADVSVAVSGIAGPSGATPGKPLGTVFLAWQIKGQPSHSELHQLTGDRNAVREQTVRIALEGILSLVDRDFV